MAIPARICSSSAGILLWLKTPNELIGVMAHETGHISAGHLSRGQYGMKKAMIPMLLSLVAGIGAMVAGAGEVGMAIMGIGQAYAMGQMAAFTRVQESTADQIAAKLLLATHQSPMGMYRTFQRFANDEAMSAYKDGQVRRRSSVRPGPRLRSQRHGGRLALSRSRRICRRCCTPSRWCRPSWAAMCCR